MHKRLILISIVNLSLFFGITCVMGQSETHQPTEELPSLVPSPTGLMSPPEYFPEYLICDEAGADEGSRWHNIEIGVSSLDDLMTTLEQFGNYEVWLMEDNYLYFGRVEDEIEKHEANSILAPSFVAVCISDDGIIVALGILSRRGFEFDIYDLVSIYGISDTVTWTVRPLDRIVFWFEAGIAASIYVGPEPEFQYLVSEIYYYPFVEGTAYENEYPFAYTREEALSSVEQNPFDFDTIIATVTAQPTRTPTATLPPRTIEATVTP